MAKVGDGLIASARFANPIVIRVSTLSCILNVLKFFRIYHSGRAKSNAFSAAS
jgi:hypothetical protein